MGCGVCLFCCFQPLCVAKQSWDFVFRFHFPIPPPQVSAEGMSAMAEAESVAVLLPTTAYILRIEYPPARKLIEASMMGSVLSCYYWDFL